MSRESRRSAPGAGSLLRWPRRAPQDSTQMERALSAEFGEDWAGRLAQRLLDSVWEGDARAVASDRRRLARVTAHQPRPGGATQARLTVLDALYPAAEHWIPVSPAADPHDDPMRFGEAQRLLQQRLELRLQTSAATNARAVEMPARGWLHAVADLIVRGVRFRDPFCLHALDGGLTAAERSAALGGALPAAAERYLREVCAYGDTVVNGAGEHQARAGDIPSALHWRFGGEYPYAAAVAAAVKAIAAADAETLQELRDLTAPAAHEDGSPAQALHSLVVAGEKALHGC